MSELVSHYPNFITKDRADTILNIFQALLPWTTFAPSPKSRKVFRLDRQTGDQTVDGIFLQLVKELLEKHNVIVNGIFCNLYRDGNDYCPYHRDNYGCDVWTLSLGDTRDFLVKEDGTGTRAQSYRLRSGDLYFMDQRLHRTHKHSIPVRKGHKGSRISIVFFTTPAPVASLST